jgi:hypothetical protein
VHWGGSCWWEKHTREVYGVIEIMVNFLFIIIVGGWWVRCKS